MYFTHLCFDSEYTVFAVVSIKPMTVSFSPFFFFFFAVLVVQVR